MIAESGLEGKVILEGFHADVHASIADAEQFVLSSDYEGMPNALLEAMMMGLPCISTQFEGATELIGDSGACLMTPKRDVEALAAAMSRLSDDPALYPQIRGIITAEDFDEGLYREAAGRYFEMLEQYFVDPLHMASGAAPIGTISPASVISIFDTDAEQTEAAALFETRIEGVHDIKERTAALKDVLLGIKKATLDRVMKDPETAGKLDEILKLKKILSAIPGMNLKLTE